jgi:hypothetical protein
MFLTFPDSYLIIKAVAQKCIFFVLTSDCLQSFSLAVVTAVAFLFMLNGYFPAIVMINRAKRLLRCNSRQIIKWMHGVGSHSIFK